MGAITKYLSFVTALFLYQYFPVFFFPENVWRELSAEFCVKNGFLWIHIQKLLNIPFKSSMEMNSPFEQQGGMIYDQKKSFFSVDSVYRAVSAIAGC